MKLKTLKQLAKKSGFNHDPNALVASNRMLKFIAIFVLCFILWASFFEIDDVTEAQGKVIPSLRTQIIQNLEGGIVNAIFVSEGSFVEKDQKLAELDNTRFLASLNESEIKQAALELKIYRLLALANDERFSPELETQRKFPELVDNEMQLYRSRVDEMQKEIRILHSQKSQKLKLVNELKHERSKLQKSYKFVEKELKMTRPLVREGAVSEVELLRLERSANDLQGDLKATTLSIPRALSALREADDIIQELKASYKTDALDELATTKAELQGLDEVNKALADRVSRTVIRSPVAGTVKKVNVNTAGGVISPGMTLMQIVPLSDNLLIEAQVKPADIALLRKGLPAIVRISAYDYARYGSLQGIVELVGADTVTDRDGVSYYQVLIRTDNNFLTLKHKKYYIIPGMTASVDIITSQRTVLSYLLEPFH